MSTQQHIIQHLYALFTYFATKSDSNLVVEVNYKVISTSASTWPNFVFDVDPNNERLNSIATGISNNKLPKHLILDSKQVDLFEDALIENHFSPIAEWSCLKLENNEPQVIKNKQLSIKKITTEHELKEWIAVASSGFGALNSNLFNNCFNNKEIALYGGYLDNKLVATSLLFYHNNTAGIYHMVTLPTERGKGFGSELFIFCQQEAIKNGAEQVIAQSTSDGLNAWLNTGMKSYGNFYLFCCNKPTP